MSRLFISHSSKDNVQAIAFKQWLGANGWGAEDIFLDLHGIGAGERWKDALKKANSRCEAVVLLASPEALESPECRVEIRMAEHFGKPILIALLRDLDISDQRLDPYREGQIVDLATPPQNHTDIVEFQGQRFDVRFNGLTLTRIKSRLIDLGVAPETFAWPPAMHPNASPYPGLEPFGERDAGIFFGRDADIMRGIDDIRLLRRVGRCRLLLIQAASGAGKSSFLRAGLWPRLRRDPDLVPLAILRPAKGIITGPNGLGFQLAAWFEEQHRTKSPGASILQSELRTTNEPARP